MSVEVLLYLVFFAACRAGLRRWWQLVLISAGGLALWIVAFRLSVPVWLVGRGLASFFLGGLAYYFVGRVGARSRRATAGMIALAAGAWALAAADPGSRAIDCAEASGSAPIRLAAKALEKLNDRRFELAVFPLTLVALALAEIRWPRLGKPRAFASLGQISYSCYLLHFPLQLAFVLVGGRFAVGSPFWGSPTALMVFFGVLIPLSLACYRLFKKPAQDSIRRRLPAHKPAVADSTGPGARVIAGRPERYP